MQIIEIEKKNLQEKCAGSCKYQIFFVSLHVVNFSELRDILKQKYPDLDIMAIRQEDLVFEERVRLKCFQCSNYRTKWTCPGHLPPFDFRRLIGEYEHLAVVVSHSATELHRTMLYLESELMKHNNPLSQSFIGGCCELCEGGCSSDRCAHPEQARIPWDATGCNVTRTLANIGIQVDFTGKESCRYGLLVW